MREEILDFYRGWGMYTWHGGYEKELQALPDDIRELGRLLCAQQIHRLTLHQGNTGRNHDLRYGDMNEYPWQRGNNDDDNFLTAPALIAELMRLDPRGFVPDRAVKDKLVISCRYFNLIFQAALKSKGIPCRMRAGFAPYLDPRCWYDHWATQYWKAEENRWVTVDSDLYLPVEEVGFDQFDIDPDHFAWAADTWLGIRAGTVDQPEKFVYLDGDQGFEDSLQAVSRSVFYDFHSLMHNEISYLYQPPFLDGRWAELTEANLQEIDGLARLLQDPDGNFDQLRQVWETNRKFRLLNGPFVRSRDQDRANREVLQ